MNVAPLIESVFAVVLMAKARDFKFKVKACSICGQRDKHLVGCPGRR